MTGKTLPLLLLSLSLYHCSFAGDHVPVLVWNPNQAKEGVPAVSALQEINYANFQAKYLSAFKPNNILLFLQDEISVEDLTSHSTELHNVKHWLESGHSLFLPAVEDAAHLVHDLPAHGYNVLKLDHDAGLNLKQDDKNLVVVELPSTETNPSRRRALQKADEVMENVISKIGDQRDFTVIFTGKKTSVDERSDQYEQRIRVARSLKAVNFADIPQYHLANCTKMYLRQNMTLTMYPTDPSKDPDVYEFEEPNSFGDIGDCQTDTASLMMKYQNATIDGKFHTKISVTLLFSMKRGSWIIDGLELTFDTNTFNFTLMNKMDSIPVGMSFACSQPYTFISNNGSFLSYKSAHLDLNGFQVQAFQREDHFDGAWDCVGFFTVPIWCGLLTTLLLVVILTMGMCMLGDIKTMDRFDDPKGQPINVPTSD